MPPPMPSSRAPPITIHPIRVSRDEALFAAGLALTAFGVAESEKVGAPTSRVGWAVVAVGSWVAVSCGRGLLVRLTWVGDGVGLGVGEWVAFGVGDTVGDGVGLTGGSVMIGVGVGLGVGDGLSAEAVPPVIRTAMVVAESSAV